MSDEEFNNRMEIGFSQAKACEGDSADAVIESYRCTGSIRHNTRSGVGVQAIGAAANPFFVAGNRGIVVGYPLFGRVIVYRPD